MVKKRKMTIRSGMRKERILLLTAMVMTCGVMIPKLTLAGGMVFLDLSTGITGATTQIHSVWALVDKLILAIGGLVGLIGGIRVYIKWNHGEREINKEIVGWAGACVFLLLVGTLLTAFGIG